MDNPKQAETLTYGIHEGPGHNNKVFKVSLELGGEKIEMFYAHPSQLKDMICQLGKYAVEWEKGFEYGGY